MNNIKAIIIVLAAVVIGIFLRWDVFTLPIQGKDTWRQSKTAWNIRYFVRHDPNIFNPRQPYLNEGENIVRYEFPFLQWSIAMVEKVTGEHVLVMRIIVFLISLLTLLAVYQLAMLFSQDTVVSALSVWTFAFLPTFFYNATSIMPDSLALCFGMYYVLYFFRHLKSSKDSDLIYAGLFISLAGLTKLPFILLGTLSLVRFFELWPGRERGRQPLIKFVLINALALVPVLLWYAIVVPGWEGNRITSGFTIGFVGWSRIYQFFKDQMLENFPYETLNIPSLILLLIGIYYFATKKHSWFFPSRYFFLLFLVMFLYFLFVLNVIGSTHEYYLIPFYPVFILAIITGIYKIMQWTNPLKNLIWVLMVAMPFLCWSRVNDYWNVKYAYFNNDYFLCRDQLSAIGTRDDLAIVLNDESTAIYSYIIDKRGFSFWNNHLPISWIKDMVKNKQAVYLYSDSRTVESQEGFMDCVSELILTCGTVNVFRLKRPEEIQM